MSFSEFLNENKIIDYMLDNLESMNRFDLSYPGSADTSEGWKLSIQGKSLDDSRFLLEHLAPYLIKNSIPFKIGTKKRIEHANKIQAKKLMTIYVPSGMDVKELAEIVYKKIKKYKGWQNIKTPPKYEHYAGGIFFRNDRDESGQYIPASA